MSYMEKFIETALENGITHLFYHMETVEKNSIGVYEGALETAQISSETLLFIEGAYDGNLGYTYTCDLDTASIEELVRHIQETARENGAPFQQRKIPESKEQTVAGAGHLDGITELLLQGEKAAKAYSEKVKDVSLSCGYTKRTITLGNEKGDAATDHMLYYQFRIRVMAAHGGQTQTAVAAPVVLTLADLDIPALCLKTAKEAVEMLPAGPCQSGEYPVILRNNVFSEIFNEYMPIFFGDNINKNMSLLAGKLDTAVAAAEFTLFEDPSGVICRSFDDEGNPAIKKEIISGGVLKTYLHNEATAKEGDQSPTGNGYKLLYNEKAAVSITNAVIEAGETPLETMIAGIEKGILITHCDGIFAGVNVFSGDFSLISKGYMIEQGAITTPVKQITIGGNVFNLLKEIACLGNDHAGHLKEGRHIKAPSVLIPALLVSGI